MEREGNSEENPVAVRQSGRKKRMSENEENNDVPMEPAADQPAAPEQQEPQGQPPQQQEQQQQQQQGREQQPDALRHAIPYELGMMGRKVTRILGRTDDLGPMKITLESTHGMMHCVDQRTTHIKNKVENTLNGLEEIYDQNKEILHELKEQHKLLREIKASSRQPSPQPGPSGTTVRTSQSKKCPFCEGDHYACDCNKFTSLRERWRRLIANERCERCLAIADHLSTSCEASTPCFYCKTAKREKVMNKHHSAFCPYKFPM